MVTQAPPRVSVVIPSWSGEIARLRSSLETQTFQDFELVVITGVAPAGRARNQGVVQARGDIIVFIDDDACLGHNGVLESLIRLLESDLTIGVVGSSKLISPSATSLQQRIAKEVPRWIYPVEEQDTESNPPLKHYGYAGITTTCCAMRRSCFLEIGGFDVQLAAGEDTEFFYRIRSAGYRFMIPRHCWVYHDPPARLGALLSKSFRYGVGHASEARKAPDRQMNILPLDRWYGLLLLVLSPLFFPVAVFISLYFSPVRHWSFGYRPVKALSTWATLYGYTVGWYKARQLAGDSITGADATLVPREQLASHSTALSALSFGAVAVINNVYALFMARLLAVHEYGALGFIQSWLLIAATLLNSGFPWELARTLARRASLAEAHRTAKGALVGNLTVALVFSGVIIIASLTSGLQTSESGALVLGLLVLETLLLSCAAVWAGVLQGQLKFKAIGLSRFVEAGVKVAGGVALVALGMNILGAVVAMVVGTLSSVMLLVWSTRAFSFYRSPGWGDLGMYRRSLIMLVGLCALTILGNLDIIGLKLFSPSQTGDLLTGYYQIAAVLSRIPVLLAGAYASALFPYLSRANSDEYKVYLERGMKYALLLVVPLNLLLLAAPEAAIRFMFPEIYLVSAQALRLAAGASLLLVLSTMFTTVLQARGYAHIPAAILPAVVTCEFVLLGALVPRYGLNGAGIAFLVASIGAFVGLACASRKLFSWHTELKTVAGYVAASLGLVVLMWILPQESRLATAASATVALAGYTALLALTRVLRPDDLTTLTAGLPLERIPFGQLSRRVMLHVIGELNSIFLKPEQSGRGQA